MVSNDNVMFQIVAVQCPVINDYCWLGSVEERNQRMFEHIEKGSCHRYKFKSHLFEW